MEGIVDRHYRTVAEYLNTGDTYTETILYDVERGSIRVMDWGTFVENFEKRHGRLP